MPGDMVAGRAAAEQDEGGTLPRHARPSRRAAKREARVVGDHTPHPGRTPALLTLAVTVLLVGAGWLTQGRDDTPTRLAVPMGTGSGAGEDDSRRPGEIGVNETAAGTPLGVSRDGEPAYVLANWLDVPMVATAVSIRPEALGTTIPITPFTGPAPGSSSGSSSGTGGSSGSGSSGSGSGSGPGGTPDDDDGGPTTTVRPGSGGPGSTTPPATTTTTGPDDTTPPATEPPTTEPPVTEPPTTEPPVTEPPTTEAPPTTEPPPPTDGGGLLGEVEDIITGTAGGLLTP